MQIFEFICKETSALLPFQRRQQTNIQYNQLQIHFCGIFVTLNKTNPLIV